MSIISNLREETLRRFWATDQPLDAGDAITFPNTPFYIVNQLVLNEHAIATRADAREVILEFLDGGRFGDDMSAWGPSCGRGDPWMGLAEALAIEILGRDVENEPDILGEARHRKDRYHETMDA